MALREYLREVMALPNLPGTHIAPAFQELKDRCPAAQTADRLQQFLQYVEKTWITSTSRPPSSWSTYKRSVRTNNDCEGWHTRLNKRVKQDHINMYLLVERLHEEATLLPLQVRLVSQKKLYRNRSKLQESKESALKDLWAEYGQDNRTLSTSEYLKRCARLSDHSEE